MSEQHDAEPDVLVGGTATDAAARTRAVVSLALSFVGLMGGGILGSALFYLTIDRSPIEVSNSLWFQASPSLVMGVLGAALGLSTATSGDDLARPLGRAAIVLGVLSVMGGVVLAVFPPR